MLNITLNIEKKANVGTILYASAIVLSTDVSNLKEYFNLFSSTIESIAGNKKRHWRIKPEVEKRINFEKNLEEYFFRARVTFLDEIGDEVLPNTEFSKYGLFVQRECKINA